jgi:hypothetical protein
MMMIMMNEKSTLYIDIITIITIMYYHTAHLLKLGIIQNRKTRNKTFLFNTFTQAFFFVNYFDYVPILLNVRYILDIYSANK